MKEKTAWRFLNRNIWKIARTKAGVSIKPSFIKRVRACCAVLYLPSPL